jgi:hypothetical protein
MAACARLLNRVDIERWGSTYKSELVLPIE